jgi:hypothetical protein
MKKYIIITVLILMLGGTTQTPVLANTPVDWQWSAIEIVSAESDHYSIGPEIVRDPSGNIHMIWEEWDEIAGSGSDVDIFYKKLDVPTQVWSSAEVVSTESTTNSFDPSISSDPLGNIHVVWEEVSDYGGSGIDRDIFYKKLDVSTLSWSTTEVISTESTQISYDPSIVSDSQGNIHVTWEDYSDYDSSGTDADIFYKKWNVEFLNWSITEVISIFNSGNSYDPFITSDRMDNIHIAWHDDVDLNGADTDFDIFYTKWDTKSDEWGTVGVISTESTDSSVYAFIVVDNMMNVHVTWHDVTDYDGSGTDTDIFYKQWNVDAQIWTTTEVISTESTSSAFYPNLISDSYENIHVFWQDRTDTNNGAGIDTDIFHKVRTPEDTSWSTSSFLVTTETMDSETPSVAIDNSDFIHLVWCDAGGSTSKDIFYSKLSGIAQTPVLKDIIPNPNNGINHLEWEKAYGANSYSIYRDLIPIHSIGGLTAIAETENLYYVDELDNGGIYYYAITANNPEGSSLSNTVYAQVEMVTETVTENNTVIVNDIITQFSTENVTISNGGFVNYPVSISLLFVSSILMIMIQRRKHV